MQRAGAGAIVAIVCAGFGLAFQTESEAAKAARASEAMKTGRYQEAAALYRELVAALPANAGLRMNLGLAEYQSGRYSEAAGSLQIALKQDAALAPAWLMLGMARLKLGQAKLAIAPLQRYLRAQPDNRDARLELASALLRAGRAGEAAAHYKKLTDRLPNEPKPWQGLALSYIALGQAAFHDLEARAPASGYRLMLLARSALERRQPRSAMRLYREALDRIPDLPEAHAGLAEAYRRTGHPDLAAEEDARERALPPPDCTTHPLECQFAAGRYDCVGKPAAGGSGRPQKALGTESSVPGLRTAEALYWRSRGCSALADRALEHLASMPPSSAVHELLAEAARLRGDLDRAAREWEQALALAPGDRRVEKGFARVLWLKRDPRALPLLTKLVRLEPESAELNFEYGDLLMDESPTAAVEALKTALKLRPHHLGAHAALGRAYMRLERPALAIPELAVALPMDTDGKLYYQLARAYQLAGREELAHQTMQKYRERAKAARARQPAMDEDLKP